MSWIPDEELRKQSSLNLAPMVDFLFVVLAVFATLAVTRTALYDSEVKLVQVRPHEKGSPLSAQNDFYTVHLSVTEEGKYKWITETSEFLLQEVSSIHQELSKQQELGLLPKEPGKTKVLLHIDQAAKWAPISDAIFAVRDAGFTIHPVYEPREESADQ
ncbi:MAG: ExbD/TolR family protein [Chlamydiales bacterium]